MSVLATAPAVQSLGLIVVTALIGGWLLATTPRLRLISGLLALLVAPLVLAGSVVGDESSSLPSLSPALIALAVVAGALILAAVAAVFVKWPRAVVPATLATLAFRVPLTIGGETVKLLLPLYLTIAGAVVAAAWSNWRGRAPVERRSPKLLDVAIVLYLVLYAVQSLWAPDPAVATQNVCFFYAPFALLYGLASTQKWDRNLMLASVVTLVGVALLLALGGFVEFARGRYLITLGGTQPSDFDPYFRVQSFFFDPNIYGRFLAVVMLVVCSVMLWTRRASRVGWCAVLLLIFWAALALSLSQSSFAALLAGLVALAAMRWSTKPVLVAAGAVLAAGIVFALAVPSVSGIRLGDSRSAEATTSGRFDLVKGALELWGQKPVFGHGSGSFSDAYREQNLSTSSAFGPAVTTKSHTAPLTVAAEQGVVGLAAFIFLLWTGFAAVFRRVKPEDPPRPGLVARVAVAAAFTAVFVHTLAYAALLEDPLFWVLLGCAVSLAAIERSGKGES
jgi:O-antigen ligase